MIKAIGFFYQNEKHKQIQFFNYRVTPSKKTVLFTEEPFTGNIMDLVGPYVLQDLNVVEELKVKNKLWAFAEDVKKFGAVIYKHPQGDDWLITLNRSTEPTIEEIETKVTKGKEVAHHFRHKAFHGKGIKTTIRRKEKK